MKTQRWLALVTFAALSLSAERASALIVSEDQGIPYMSGGVGADEREAVAARAMNYNLKLTFAVTNSTQFLANVSVKIEDASGKILVDAVADGPYFYAKLPAGKYRVVATSGGQVEERTVTVGGGGQAELGLYFKDHPASASAAPAPIEP